MLSKVDSWKQTHFLRINHTRRTYRVHCKEIDNWEKEKYFDDQQKQWESELRKTVFWKKKYCRVSEKMCVRCKFKDHAKLNCLNSWFIFSETFFSEASSAFNNIFIINILKKDLTW